VNWFDRGEPSEDGMKLTVRAEQSAFCPDRPPTLTITPTLHSHQDFEIFLTATFYTGCIQYSCLATKRYSCTHTPQTKSSSS
jgi:hypothetical protein